jgi:hypothetical protein
MEQGYAPHGYAHGMHSYGGYLPNMPPMQTMQNLPAYSAYHAGYPMPMYGGVGIGVAGYMPNAGLAGQIQQMNLGGSASSQVHRGVLENQHRQPQQPQTYLPDEAKYDATYLSHTDRKSSLRDDSAKSPTAGLGSPVMRGDRVSAALRTQTQAESHRQGVADQ